MNTQPLASLAKWLQNFTSHLTKFLFKFLQDITIEGYYVLKNFCQNFVYSIIPKKMPCQFANISTIYWRVVSYLELSFITLFHHCL